jgi:hypothetical protein
MDKKKDYDSDEICDVCGTKMLRRVRTDEPPLKGSPTFQAEWYHCPTCNCMRKMIDGAVRQRTQEGIWEFKKELRAKEDKERGH